MRWVPLICAIVFTFSDGNLLSQINSIYREVQNVTCNVSLSLFDETLDSVLLCSRTCAYLSPCTGFTYNIVSRRCIGCIAKESVTGSYMAGYRHYEDLRDTYNTSCVADFHCNGKHTICEITRQVCTCFPGYSYNPSNGSCTLGCDVYGNTYESYPNYDLDKLNTVIEIGLGLEECRNMCNNATTFLCLSFDVDGTDFDGNCRLSVESAGTQPLKFMPEPGTTYYNRNCA